MKNLTTQEIKSVNGGAKVNSEKPHGQIFGCEVRAGLFQLG